MATAVETYTWALYEDDLKAYLDLTGDASEDDNLQTWLASAAADCDLYCGWIHYDRDTKEEIDDSPDDLTIYPLLKQGIFEWVRVFRVNQLGRAAATGLEQAKMGPLTETYGGGRLGITPTSLARAAAEELWDGEVLNPLHSGKGYNS